MFFKDDEAVLLLLGFGAAAVFGRLGLFGDLGHEVVVLLVVCYQFIVHVVDVNKGVSYLCSLRMD
jgi:hypothetical protein